MSFGTFYDFYSISAEIETDFNEIEVPLILTGSGEKEKHGFSTLTLLLLLKCLVERLMISTASLLRLKLVAVELNKL